MAGKIGFYKQIVESMDEGVMVLASEGKVTLFNDAAAKILDVPPQTVMNKPFGQVFMMEMEDNDEFYQVILDAVYESAVGMSNTIEYKRKDGGIRVIKMTASYLKSSEGVTGDDTGEDPDGRTDKAVVIVLNDITEITQSRENEKELNRKLTQAFLKLEENNKRLEAKVHKRKRVRFFILLALMIGLAGTAGFLWFQGSLRSDLSGGNHMAAAPDAAAMETVRVMVRPLNRAISLSGSVAPLEEITVTSPFDGKVKEVNFIYDQEVEKGQVLVRMDTEKLEKDLRAAKAAWIKARQAYRDIVNWQNSSEVSEARRSLRRANNSLDQSRRELKENQSLFEKGIISRSELDSAVQELANQEMDYAASKESLDNILEKGNQENQDIAKMELENVRVNRLEIEEKLKTTVVRAPVSGIVIQPASTGIGSGESKVLAPGLSLSQGEAMVIIGNLEGFSVKTKVNEIDIGKIRFDQKVRVTGDAFAGMPLEGRVRYISSNAQPDSMEGPVFEVTVWVDDPPPGFRKKIRLGMSTNLEVVVYDNPQAILVPLDAVELMGDQAVVRVKDDAGRFVERTVRTGMTTLDAVEIVDGLGPDDVIQCP